MYDERMCLERRHFFVSGDGKRAFFRPSGWSRQVVAIVVPLTVRPPTFGTGFCYHFWGRESVPPSEATEKTEAVVFHRGRWRLRVRLYVKSIAPLSVCTSGTRAHACAHAHAHVGAVRPTVRVDVMHDSTSMCPCTRTCRSCWAHVHTACVPTGEKHTRVSPLL